MSNIDNLRLKGANAKTANVGVTGNDLLTIINYANEQGQIGTGDIKSDGSVPFTGQEDFQSGLKVDTITPSGTSLVSFATMLGLKVYTTAQEALLVPTAGAAIWNSDLNAVRVYNGSVWQNATNGLLADGTVAGATANPQVFEQGVELGIDNGTNGELTFYNNDSTGSVMISSGADKDLTIDNAGNDVDFRVNGQALFYDPNSSPTAFIVYDQFNDVNAIQVDNTAATLTLNPLNGVFLKGIKAISGSNLDIHNDLNNKVIYIEKSTINVVIGDVDGGGTGTKLEITDGSQIIRATALSGFFATAGVSVAGAGSPGTSDNAWLKIGEGSADHAHINLLVSSAAPTFPNDGDIWLESNTNTGLKIRINGVTKTITLS